MKISPAFTLTGSDGVSEIINFTQVFMCFFDSDQDPLPHIDTRRWEAIGPWAAAYSPDKGYTNPHLLLEI